MRYVGKCKAGHSFNGRLEVPKGHTAPASFAERCPVPYCEHFITYKPKEVDRTNGETAHAIVNELNAAVDECNILARHLMGIYEPLEDGEIKKQLKSIAGRIRAAKSHMPE